MALQTFSVRRAQDPTLAAAVNSEITPLNWHRFPGAPLPNAPQNVPTVTYNGGVKGDDVDVSTANSTSTYGPRTQAQKATALGTVIAEDVTRPRGYIAPAQPYGAKPAAPVVTTVAPNTAAAGSNPLVVTITGTGFTQYSKVISGGTGSPWDAAAQYVSPTQMKILIDPRPSIAGAISIAVEDHDVLSNTDKLFTFT